VAQWVADTAERGLEHSPGAAATTRNSGEKGDRGKMKVSTSFLMGCFAFRLNLPFLVILCVTANIHKIVMVLSKSMIERCVRKDQKMTVSHGKFSLSQMVFFFDAF
jgi:hypothetical protein